VVPANTTAPGGSLFTCDGVTQNNFVVQVLPDPGSPPFHGGGAIVRADFGIFSDSGNEGVGTTVSVNIHG